MASFSMFKFTLLLSLLVVFVKGDPDITDDFLIPSNVNPNSIDGNFFTFTGLRKIVGSNVPDFRATKVTKTEFPALDGQGVSLSILQFPPGSINPPHSHPRSWEALFVLSGSVELGFIDPSTGKLNNKTMPTNYFYVVPQGTMHYQQNANKSAAASVLSAFGSSNPGTISLPTALFGTGVDDKILSRSFATDVDTIKKIKAAFGGTKF
ncbi:OLC1v1004639C1 [Oldenlandia corymbosa var. corymbosa]|uniref:Germin-like protein n=1 Tax=Oldenlandia corymbosa var. corymbosa TaxID=529605 RepID=A0AAV1DE27_OLDCO|nr:OLC1v1004639C1 [Oldenlandia corymbosa var. corymbosa]